MSNLFSLFFQYPSYIYFLNFHMCFVAGLMQAFRPFGALTIEWPGKDGKHSRHPPKG